MTHVSRRRLSKETQQQLDSALVWVFSRLKENEVNLIFEQLITSTERIMLAKRLGTLFLLKEGMPESSVAETLKLTQATVSRISLAHRLVSPPSTQFLFRKLTSWKDYNTFKKILKTVAIQLIKNLRYGFSG